jgi:predicted kinase
MKGTAMDREKRRAWIAMLNKEEAIAILNGLDATLEALDGRMAHGQGEEYRERWDFVNELREDIQDVQMARAGLKVVKE